MQTTIIIKGTHCNACKVLIEDVCKDIKGIASCTVNFQTGETVVEYEESIDWQAFKKEIDNVGQYTVQAQLVPPSIVFIKK